MNSQNGTCMSRFANDQKPSSCVPPVAATTRFTPWLRASAASPTAWNPTPNASISRRVPRVSRGVSMGSGDAIAISTDPASARTIAAEARPHTPQPMATVAMAQP